MRYMGLAGMEKQSRFYAWTWDQGRQEQEDQVGGSGDMRFMEGMQGETAIIQEHLRSSIWKSVFWKLPKINEGDSKNSLKTKGDRVPIAVFFFFFSFSQRKLPVLGQGYSI